MRTTDNGHFIYIPLWFYSNKKIARNIFEHSSFTFHYGSILIRKADMLHQVSMIYIPLWFYSNTTAATGGALSLIFTFHYGSILIFYRIKFCCLKSTIYIPLWFYSNNGICHILTFSKRIYIPLWFYSN